MVINDFTATAKISINSNRREVWDALVNPAAIKHYMQGAVVESGWREGSEITWKGEFDDQKYEDKGVILKIEPETMFKYSHFSSLSGKADIADNYHFVTINLADGSDRTEVSLTQDNNEDDTARIEAEKSWKEMLQGLKAYVERV